MNSHAIQAEIDLNNQKFINVLYREVVIESLMFLLLIIPLNFAYMVSIVRSSFLNVNKYNRY